MLLMYTMTIPTTSIPQFVQAALKNFQELPFPDYIKATGPFGLLSEDGAKTYALFEIEKGKEEEAIELLNKRTFKYAPVKGYKQKFEIIGTMQELLSFVDLEAF